MNEISKRKLSCLTQYPQPWEQVSVDQFELDKRHYLIMVNFYNNFWEVDSLSSTSAKAVINKLRTHFARYGCPDCLISDNGPQFMASEFERFAKG
ncbi:hypothetical protein P5673_018671 [Acropora cervicornis]|uniref:Integrase catalytic domain-containing protein n=1 Tax=Acropora cervicornis TaxID=6130 RepID=A0AAD9V2R2_ACRCE|nr:hypothetical protein P5673_018671 [Acropora cervicornis]